MDDLDQPGTSKALLNPMNVPADDFSMLSDSDEENAETNLSLSDDESSTVMSAANLRNLQTAVNGLVDVEDSEDDYSEWPDCDSVVVLLAMNQAYSELVDQLIAKVQFALQQNKRLQKDIEAKKKNLKESEGHVKLKIPLMQYLPPYFKDESGMCPRLNDEAKRKQQISLFDPLARDEKKWTKAEVKVLHAAVRQATIDSRTEKFRNRKDVLANKIAASGVETNDIERQMWKDELQQMKNKIDYIRHQSDDELLIGDFKDIDWWKISNVDFSAARTPTSIRLKWLNEASPIWNQGEWTTEELTKLKHLREEDFISSSWPVLANRLGTRRSPWQCFEKYKTEVEQNNRDWTISEDEKLIALANMLTVNGKIQWEKVTYYMPGRSRQQIRTRYLRTLDKNVKHGRWTDQEDLLLMCAVNRFGAKDWAKVACSVPGRTDIQCRERWVSTLDRRALSADWSLEDDEKIIFAVQIFGREWFRIGQLLNRPIKQVRARYVSLMTAKIKLCAAQEGELHCRTVRIDNQHRSFYNRADVNKIYRTFNALMKGNDPHGDEMLKRIDEKTTSASSKNVWKGVTKEQKEAWEIKEADISKRHSENNPVNISEMLANIPFTERDAEKVLRSRFSRRTMANRVNKPFAQAAPDVTARIEFVDNEPEAERIMCMTEALCQAVHISQQNEWAESFKKGASRKASHSATAYMVDKLHQNMEQSAICFRDELAQSPLSTLPPNTTSISGWEAFQRTRSSLCDIASHAFTHSSQSITCPNDVPSRKQFSALDKLFIPLNAEIKQSEEYLKLKALMRTVLLEPARLVIACDSEVNQCVRDRNHLQVAERTIEMSAMRDLDDEPITTSAGEGSSAPVNDLRQVTIATGAYVSDGGRSTLDFTIDQVVEKVCRSSARTQSPIQTNTPQVPKKTKNIQYSELTTYLRPEDGSSTNVPRKRKQPSIDPDETSAMKSMDKIVKLEEQSLSRSERAKRRSTLNEDDRIAEQPMEEPKKSQRKGQKTSSPSGTPASPMKKRSLPTVNEEVVEAQNDLFGDISD